ncbi:multiple epidermal growth factor-like domains protein 11 [Haliotis asinina]|uniref:multiple epidermal growth factor-like domains protein 11 n=1 Tax=Haliotis asinina TaxID=109174 RepID=UPI0035322E6A
MRLLVLTFAVLFEFSSGTDLCSISDTNVTCSTCQDLCREGEDSCFKCPTGCGTDCETTCSGTCLFRECEYTQAGLKCTHGCKEGWTGVFCKELCPHNCVQCDQFNSTCLPSVEGHQGDGCNDTTTGVAHNPHTITTGSETARTTFNNSTVSYRSTDGYRGSNSSQQDNPGAEEWQAARIGIGLAGAVVLILCAAVGYKLYRVHGCPQRETEVTNGHPPIPPQVQFSVGDDTGESGIYVYVIVEEAG